MCVLWDLSCSVPAAFLLTLQPSHRGFEFKLGGVQIQLIGFQGAVVFDKTGNIKGSRWKGAASVSTYVPLVCLNCTVGAANRSYRTNQCDGKSICSQILGCYLFIQMDAVCFVAFDGKKKKTYIHIAGVVFTHISVLYHHFPLT